MRIEEPVVETDENRPSRSELAAAIGQTGDEVPATEPAVAANDDDGDDLAEAA
jgi:hypothetical protein